MNTAMLDQLQPGDTIYTVHHSAIPDREGHALTIERNRATFLEATHPVYGPGYRVGKPKRKRDVLIDNERCTGYYLDHVGGEQRWSYVEYVKRAGGQYD